MKFTREKLEKAFIYLTGINKKTAEPEKQIPRFEVGSRPQKCILLYIRQLK